jgi:hypothetical protein
VDDADHLDAVLEWPIKYQMTSETSHPEHPHSAKSRIPELGDSAHERMTCKKPKHIFRRLVELQRGLDTLTPGQELSLIVEIVLRGGSDQDPPALHLAAFGAL